MGTTASKKVSATPKKASAASTKGTTTSKKASATAAKAAAKPKKASAAPPSPISAAAAKEALALETKAIRKLQKDVAKNGWQIGKRLAQVVTLELHGAGGFASMEEYAEKVLGISRSTAFRYVRVAQAFSESVAMSFGIDRLEGGLAYIAKTPEDEVPHDVPTLKVRVPRDDGTVEEKPFSEVTVRELGRATGREAQLAGTQRKKKSQASVAAHAKQIAAANKALDSAVGPADAPRAELSMRDDGGDVVVDIRGVPRVHAAAALRAVAKALD